MKIVIFFIFILLQFVNAQERVNESSKETILSFSTKNLTDEYQVSAKKLFNENKKYLIDYLSSFKNIKHPSELILTFDDNQGKWLTILIMQIEIPGATNDTDNLLSYKKDWTGINIYPLAKMFSILNGFFLSVSNTHTINIVIRNNKNDYIAFTSSAYQLSKHIFKIEPYVIVNIEQNSYIVNNNCSIYMNTAARRFCLPSPISPSGKINNNIYLWKFLNLDYKKRINIH